VSQHFTNYFNPPYSGFLVVEQNISYCTQSKLPPRCVPLVFDWNRYIALPFGGTNPTIGVAVNLNQQQIVNPLDIIQSIVIDNLGVGYPVTVYFPDTGFEVICPANDQIAAPVLTNGLQATVFINGLPGTTLSGAPTTTVYFGNVAQMPVNGVQVPVPVQVLSGSNLATHVQFLATNNPGNPKAWSNQPAGDLWTIIDLNLFTNAMTVYYNNGPASVTDVLSNYRGSIVAGSTSMIVSQIRLTQSWLVNPLNSFVQPVLNLYFPSINVYLFTHRLSVPTGYSGSLTLKDDSQIFGAYAPPAGALVLALASNTSQFYGHVQLELNYSLWN